VKEAARLAREKPQDGGELTSPALGLISHQVSGPCPPRLDTQSQPDTHLKLGVEGSLPVLVPRVRCSQVS
jgi:homer protein